MTNLNLIKFSEIKDESQKQLISNVDSIIEEIESGKYEFEASDDKDKWRLRLCQKN